MLQQEAKIGDAANMKLARILALTLASIGLLSTPAHADIAGRYETVDENAIMEMEMTIEADEEGNVRTQVARLGAYFLLREGQMYQVANGETGPFVVRVTDLMTLQAEFASEFFRDSPSEVDIPSQVFAVFEEEVVQGRNGTGYGIISETSPEPLYAPIVVSDDLSLAPLGEAIAASNEAMAENMTAWGQMGTVLGMMNSEMLTVLRKGAPLRLLRLELKDVYLEASPPGRFELPANPITL
jgi:hypothetical protein